MNMKHYIILAIVTALMALTSCEKDGALIYNSPTYVYFSEDTASDFSFVFLSSDIDEEIAFLDVKLMGNPFDKDVTVKLEQVFDSIWSYNYEGGVKVDSTKVIAPGMGIEGVDFNFLPEEEYVIKAGKVSAKLPIKLYRTEALKSGNIQIILNLINNGNLLVGKYNKKMRLDVTDELTMPANWWPNYWGNWSKTKHRFMIDVLGLKIDEKWLSDITKSIDISLLDYYSRLLKDALQKYEQEHGDPLLDENDMQVVFP